MALAFFPHKITTRTAHNSLCTVCMLLDCCLRSGVAAAGPSASRGGRPTSGSARGTAPGPSEQNASLRTSGFTLAQRTALVVISSRSRCSPLDRFQFSVPYCALASTAADTMRHAIPVHRRETRGPGARSSFAIRSPGRGSGLGAKNCLQPCHPVQPPLLLATPPPVQPSPFPRLSLPQSCPPSFALTRQRIPTTPALPVVSPVPPPT